MPKIAGFWVNHLYVPPTWKTCASITNQFLTAKDDRQSLKTFINTVLAEEWVEEGVAPDKEILYARREGYPFGEQGGRAAGRPVSHCCRRRAGESAASRSGNQGMGPWSRELVDGLLDPAGVRENGQELPVSSKELWDDLDELLYREWMHESGRTLPILAICIDTGKLPKPVYEFARRPGHHQLQLRAAGY